VMQLLEVVLIEILEETPRTHRVCRDVEVVYVPVPVLANVGCGGGAGR
jgi:hypothetical protein